MKNILIAFCVLFATILLFSCNNNTNGDLVTDNGAVFISKDTLTSAQMIPQINTPYSGSVKGWYDEYANVFVYTLSWYNLWVANADTLSAIKFYNSSLDIDIGTLVRTIPIVNYNFTSSQTFSLSGNIGFMPAEKTDFYNKKWYLVLCSKRFPNGIIRGQINPAKR